MSFLYFLYLHKDSIFLKLVSNTYSRVDYGNSSFSSILLLPLVPLSSLAILLLLLISTSLFVFWLHTINSHSFHSSHFSIAIVIDALFSSYYYSLIFPLYFTLVFSCPSLSLNTHTNRARRLTLLSNLTTYPVC